MAWVLVAIAAAGCAEKAKTVQVGASQFMTESFSAIQKIDALRVAEVTAAPLSPVQAADKFVALVEGSTEPITQATLQVLLNPTAIGTPSSAGQWQAFLDKLRQQYATFASIFSSLDSGSLLAAPDVKRAIPLLDPLTAQMTAFAQSLQANPAVFVAERANVAADLEHVRADGALSASQKRTALLALRQKLLAVAAAEKQMTADTVAQCLKAARLGLELRGLLATYDTLTTDDLLDGLAEAFLVAGDVTGHDFAGLQQRTETLIAEMTATPELKALFDAALARIGGTLTKARVDAATGG